MPSSSKIMTPRVLLYRSGALGDTLLCLPALDALRHAYPGAHIAFAAHPAYAAPLLGAGRIDSLLDSGGPPFHLLHTEPVMSPPEGDDELDSLLKDFNTIILFTRDPDGTTARRLAAIEGAETRIAHPFPPEGSQRHIAEWGLLSAHAAPKANISISDITPLTQSIKIQSDANDSLKRIGVPESPLLAIHPGGGGQPKWPPLATLISLARQYCHTSGAAPLLITGPADEAPTTGFEKAWGSQTLRLESPPLEVLSAILARASAYIGGDSGVTHLAALSGTPTLALFGPASNPARWAPINPRGPSGAVWIPWDNANDAIKNLDEITDLTE
jgi:heptosyltransferase-3